MAEEGHKTNFRERRRLARPQHGPAQGAAEQLGGEGIPHAFADPLRHAAGSALCRGHGETARSDRDQAVRPAQPGRHPAGVRRHGETGLGTLHPHHDRPGEPGRLRGRLHAGEWHPANAAQSDQPAVRGRKRLDITRMVDAKTARAINEAVDASIYTLVRTVAGPDRGGDSRLPAEAWDKK